MPTVPLVSPCTNKPTPASFIHTTASSFVDVHGRTLLLRGVNLSGSSKAPVDMPSWIREGFWETPESDSDDPQEYNEHKSKYSFIGRPLNLDDGSADVHLARLRGWGFNMLRYPITWESIEHAGPGKYDEEFIAYTIRVLRKCKEYGFKVFMDPHQDTWSRFSGGSGAPLWTLPACGLNARNMTATQAAIVHCEYPLAHDTDPASLPAMIWSTNYGRLASQTIFTLFFSGKEYTPNAIIDGVNIQDYLQSHYVEAMGRMADAIASAGDLLEECVIGWDSMNEPFEGLCGWGNLSVNPTKQGSTLKKGTHPTPAQSLRLGMGQAQTVENWNFGTFGPGRDGVVTIDPKGLRVWADPEEIGEQEDGTNTRWGWKRDVTKWKLGQCLWAQHGVWDIETGYILRPDYFATDDEFIDVYWKPHFLTFTKRIRSAHPEAILFIQPPVFALPPSFTPQELSGRAAYSAHYYDGLTLVTRHWNWFNADALGLLRGKYSSAIQALKVGSTAIRKSLQEQLAMLKSDCDEIVGPYPTLIGEIGTPFDMDGKRSYGWTDGGKYKGNYERQEKALDASLNAADGPNDLSWTVWTYCPDSTHQWGDGWNMEDLSLWSGDDMHYLDNGDEFAHDYSEQTTLGQTSVFGINDSSRAALLSTARQKRQRGYSVGTKSLAAASLISVSTLGFGVTPGPTPVLASKLPAFLRSDSPDSDSRHRLRNELLLRSLQTSPYTFLTDGARAVRAFARPWPIAVVGKSVDIRFDIAKAEFVLKVRVSSSDRLVVEEKGERLGTEIYVPLVHYAHKDVLTLHEQRRDAVLKQQLSCSGEETQVNESPTDEQNPHHKRDASDVTFRTSTSRLRPMLETNLSNDSAALAEMDLGANAMEQSISMGSMLSTSSAGDPQTASHGTTASSSTLRDQLQSNSSPLGLGKEVLDVLVTVTANTTYAVEGQLLKWWYDVPAEGEADVEYEIVIKRNGGPIKVLPPPPRNRQGIQQDEPAGWLYQLCPEDDCRVM